MSKFRKNFAETLKKDMGYEIHEEFIKDYFKPIKINRFEFELLKDQILNNPNDPMEALSRFDDVLGQRDNGEDPPSLDPTEKKTDFINCFGINMSKGDR